MPDELPYFRLRRPCTSCPFRTDKKFPLHKMRAADIAGKLKEGKPFHCHKTVDYRDEEAPNVDESALCAGAMIVQHKEGTDGQMVQLAVRLGFYDPSVLDLSAPVPDSLNEWVQFMEDE